MRRVSFVFALLLFCANGFAAGSIAQLQLLTEQKEFARVLNLGGKMLAQNPDEPNILFMLAYANQMTNRSDEAVALYRQLIQSHPQLPEPRNNLAMIHLAAGDYDRASELLVDAINTHSSYATAYANLIRVYKGIASEAYRRAVSESSEPAKYIHDIELTAITELDGLDAPPEPVQVAVVQAPPSPAPVETSAVSATEIDLDALMIGNVRDWAEAWSSKSFDAYIAAYTTNYRAKFSSHEKWREHRRSRILRPGEIKVEVSKFSVKRRADDRVSVDFIQAFSSPGYSDRVVKRLDFRRIGEQWKIASERVLSVL